jgi:dTDP-4-dehydrorhamnose 3,5-epimerase-like enzyme
MNEVEVKQIPGVMLGDYLKFTDLRGETTVHRLSNNHIMSFTSHIVSSNKHTGTVRGFHFQLMPKGEAKYVWCSQGKALDILIDLRSGVENDCNWARITLDSEDRKFLYIPEGVAHGYQTQEEDTVINYLISGPYDPEMAVRINPRLPKLKDTWPMEISVIDASDENGVSIEKALRLWTNSNIENEG